MTGATLLLLQTLRLAAWSSYEDVTRSNDWSTVGAQLTATTARGHSAWVAGERFGRYGETDVMLRGGGVVHAGARWWLTAEAGTSREPVFTPRNTWEVDVTALAAPRVSGGIGYRRWNYTAGPVDIVMPHAALQTRSLAWDGRVYISRNPAERTDVAFTLRLTKPLNRRTAVWLLGGAGRESYVVGGGAIQSLKTVTGAAGLRYNAGGGATLRLAVTVIDSDLVLSRRGASLGIER